ncbi:hypothetical protein GCM10017668_16320 [Streptomyces tuirus]|uniref:Uncharacterized protein n=1 Tax=Streptomyces tuirus TaxID=68278 RepID=A0A7G1NAI6_9ACTN|nr:hypothetical protein GCM10017668_16320 [Streptomyces tuirus]
MARGLESGGGGLGLASAGVARVLRQLGARVSRRQGAARVRVADPGDTVAARVPVLPARRGSASA